MEYDKAVEAAEFLRHHAPNEPPQAAVICGSGLGAFADSLDSQTRVPTVTIPHFAASTVEGHAGQIVFGKLPGTQTPIIAVQGRLHTYEGHSIHATVFVVRVLALLGVKTLVVTNAAGGINPSYKVGDLMVISDHLNIPGMGVLNPLRGPNEVSFGGPRFLPTNNAYSHALRHKFFAIADSAKLGRSVHEGTYTMLSGPTYETSAEVRFLQLIGTDAVGMSSVPEVITALHSGMQVLGVSLITNAAISTPPRSGRLPPSNDATVAEPSHAEVVDEAAKAASDVEFLVTEFVKSL